MIVEIDQSGKVEQLNTHTVVACANGTSSAVLVTASVKRTLIRRFRKSLIPRKDLYPILFSVLVYILLQNLKSSPSVLIIDEEYTGKDSLIRETLFKLLGEKNKDSIQVRFKQVGKLSPAHKVAWKTYRTKPRDTKRIKANEVLELWQ